MNLRFTKMHGLGNDFVLIDCRDKAVSDQLTAVSDLSKRLCHRRFGDWSIPGAVIVSFKYS